MSGTGFPQFSVVRAIFYVHPLLNVDRDGELVPLPLRDGPQAEILVLVDERWTPPGCETWWISDPELTKRASIHLLARGLPE